LLEAVKQETANRKEGGFLLCGESTAPCLRFATASPSKGGERLKRKKAFNGFPPLEGERR